MIIQFCPHCGVKLEPNFKFCPACGQLLPRQDLEEPVTSTISQITVSPSSTGITSQVSVKSRSPLLRSSCSPRKQRKTRADAESCSQSSQAVPTADHSSHSAGTLSSPKKRRDESLSLESSTSKDVATELNWEEAIDWSRLESQISESKDWNIKRKAKFTLQQLDILVTEVSKNNSKLFGKGLERLTLVERDKIWEEIKEKVNSVSSIKRNIRDVKKRWDDLKRRTLQKIAYARNSSKDQNRRYILGLSSLERRVEAMLRRRGKAILFSQTSQSPGHTVYFETDDTTEDSFSDVDPGFFSQRTEYSLQEGPTSDCACPSHFLLHSPSIISEHEDNTVPPEPCNILHSTSDGEESSQTPPFQVLQFSDLDFRLLKTQMEQTAALQAGIVHIQQGLANLTKIHTALADRIEAAICQLSQSFIPVANHVVAATELMVASLQQNSLLMARLVEMLQIQQQGLQTADHLHFVFPGELSSVAASAAHSHNESPFENILKANPP
ncbi:inactive serine/threonine-protein kinase VRK3 isoform X1 [Erpetoichthys calabaricus]|uniref:inactive serine/threonine-protein kinase VRK3 isoform X1 n=1 Tax=Erpetoichthys calabaricus TaxID=27687 RepID=UPI00109F308E|nr:inactive serine/threonine-protein kinase VRK3 isoform X1 [Erpetoichthys calabaricus]